MRIAVVITTYNRKTALEKLLCNLNELTIPDSIVLHKIIINDGSSDGTSEMLGSRFLETEVISGNGNLWWTKCMNLGFKKAMDLRSDFVLILNDDNEVKPDYLVKLLNDYKLLPNGSILGSASVSLSLPSKIESAGTKDFIKWRLKFTPYFSGFKIVDENFKDVHKTWTLSGRGTLIPISTFKSIGFYDENLIQYGSDDEFCIRANLNNIPVFISWNANVFNHTNSTAKGTVFKKEGVMVLIRSFFNKYSVNSLRKHVYLYKKYSYPILMPIYLLMVILGTFKAYYFNYNND